MVFPTYLNKLGVVFIMFLVGCTTEARITRLNKKLSQNRTVELNSSDQAIAFSSDVLWKELTILCDTSNPWPIGEYASDEGHSFIPSKILNCPPLEKGVKYLVEVDVVPKGAPAQYVQLLVFDRHPVDASGDSVVYTGVAIDELDLTTTKLNYKILGTGKEEEIELSWNPATDTQLIESINEAAFDSVQHALSEQIAQHLQWYNLYTSQGISGHFDHSKQHISKDSAEALLIRLTWEVSIEQIRFVRSDEGGAGVLQIKEHSYGMW